MMPFACTAASQQDEGQQERRSISGGSAQNRHHRKLTKIFFFHYKYFRDTKIIQTVLSVAFLSATTKKNYSHK